MTTTDDLEAVVRLAVLTEDRTPVEQRALLRLAMKVEHDRNALVVGNRRPRSEPACRLVDDVLRSGWDDEKDRALPGLKPDVLAKIEQRRERWESPDEKNYATTRGDTSA